MSISGNLDTMDLAELLQWVAQSLKSGTLVIDNARIQKKIYFERGAIIATASTDPNERLGHFLVGQGLLTETELRVALEQQEASRMLLGKVLVTMETVSEEDLQKQLVHKAEESIFDMFFWKSAEFRFVDEQPLSRGMIPLQLDVTGIVLRAAERVDEWGRISKVIPSNQCVPVAVGFLDAPAPGAKRILELVNDDRSIEEICLETHSSEFFVSRVLWEGLTNGKIKMVRPRVEKTVDEDQPLEAIGPATHLELADNFITNGDYHSALRHLNAARSLDPQGRSTAKAIDDTEGQIGSRLAKEGITMEAVPHIRRNPEEIRELRLSPEEGFVMSRIDGRYDIESILKISPMPSLDARLVFRKLMLNGHIRLNQPYD